MTDKEALEYFKRRKELIGLSDRVQQAEALAIKALEKQIPRKPLKSDREIRYCEVFKCPICGFDFSGRVIEFCYRCGQALDWSEKE